MIFAASCSDKNMTKNPDGSFTVNTVELGKEIGGYNGAVPISTTIKDDVIQDVTFLPNQETPDYLERVERGMLPKFKGLPIDRINTIDGVSGATFTSKALRRNLEAAANYYKENK